MWISAMLLTPKTPSAQIFVIAQKTELLIFFGGGAAAPQPPGSYAHAESSEK